MIFLIIACIVAISYLIITFISKQKKSGIKNSDSSVSSVINLTTPNTYTSISPTLTKYTSISPTTTSTIPTFITVNNPDGSRISKEIQKLNNNNYYIQTSDWNFPKLVYFNVLKLQYNLISTMIKFVLDDSSEPSSNIINTSKLAIYLRETSYNEITINKNNINDPNLPDLKLITQVIIGYMTFNVNFANNASYDRGYYDYITNSMVL